MHIHLSSRAGVPLYAQIVEQIRSLVASGRLMPGEEVKPIRALAEQLLVNPNTVARAYRELERAGVLCTRGTAGTFVASGADSVARADGREALAGAADSLLELSGRLGVGLDELLDLLRERQQSRENHRMEKTP